jgi:hypothetical protein
LDDQYFIEDYGTISLLPLHLFSLIHRAIGVSQMEKELEAQAESIEERFKPFERTDEPDLKIEEVRGILHDVLTELYYSKEKKKL